MKTQTGEWEARFDQLRFSDQTMWIMNQDKKVNLKDFIRQEIANARWEEREKVKYQLLKLDWIKILHEAIEGRKTSFGIYPIREWRNASDQICGSMVRHAEEKGIFRGFFTEIRTKRIKKFSTYKP